MLKNYEDKMLRDYEDKKKWFIIASGPSLTQEDVDSVKGQNVLVINDNYKLAPWADVLYACDGKWWNWYYEEAKSFKGRKITQDKKAAEQYDLEYVESVSKPGISESPEVIHQGSNSGIQAINLAYHLGAREIILLGYDMQATAGKNHWFGDHPDKVVSSWHSWIPNYNQVAIDAKKLGITIINCTRTTALKCFDRKSLDEVL